MHIFVATDLKEENISIDMTAKCHILAKERRNKIINKIAFQMISFDFYTDNCNE